MIHSNQVQSTLTHAKLPDDYAVYAAIPTYTTLPCFKVASKDTLFEQLIFLMKNKRCYRNILIFINV